MALRDRLNRNPAVAVGAIAVLVILAVVLSVRAYPRRVESKPFASTYYTTDDGQSWFADELGRIPPFDKDGKPAVKAHVFRCGGKSFVGYLERFTADGKRYLEKMKKRPQDCSPQEIRGLVEMKRPGEGKWTPLADFRNAMAIVQVRCPDGGTLEDVLP